MGTFETTIEIGDPEGGRFEPLDALVDTGSSYTWAPREFLERLGEQRVGSWEFETADGRVIERDVGRTWVRIDGQALPTLVVFGEEGSRPLLGAYALEGLRLAADPVRRRLVPVRGLALEAIETVVAGPFGSAQDRLQACPSPRRAQALQLRDNRTRSRRVMPHA